MLRLIWSTITYYTLYVPSHKFVRLIGLNKLLAHIMGYELMIKVLSTYILTNQLTKPCLIKPQLIILSPHPIFLSVP